MAAEAQHELTLESVRYRLIGSGLEATLVDTEPVQEPAAGGGKAWRCSACQADFPTARRFDAHVGLHVNVCRRQCHLCEYRLVGTVTQLRRHLASHIAGCQHACRRCGDAFQSAADLQRHRQLMHAALFRYRCDLCSRIFCGRGHLRAHSLTHSSERQHACSVCGRTFVSETVLRGHERVHREQLRCSWPGCSYIGRAANNVRAHVDRVHRKLKRFQCPQCPRGFIMRNAMRLHVRRVHREKTPQFRCPVCDGAFTSRNRLALHLRSHAKRRDQLCHLCGGTFMSSQALDRHIADHREAKGNPHIDPFKCNCGKTFRTSRTFRLHRMSHQWGQRRQPHRQSKLRQQQKAPDVTHRQCLGDNSYRGKPQGSPLLLLRPSISCLECGEKFDRGPTLELHYQERHSAAGPFHCPNCGCGFVKARLFARHRAEMHVEFVTDSGTLRQSDNPPEELISQRCATVHMPDIPGPSPRRTAVAASSSASGVAEAADQKSSRSALNFSVSLPDIAGGGLPRIAVPASECQVTILRIPDVRTRNDLPPTTKKRSASSVKASGSHKSDRTQRKIRTASVLAGRTKHTRKSAEESVSDDETGAHTSESDSDFAVEPPVRSKRPIRTSAARGGLSDKGELYKEVMGSSTDHGDDTGSDWKP